MELFIPNILAVARAENVSAETKPTIPHKDIFATGGKEFQKIYFEELVRNHYNESKNFAALSNVARVYHEEYFGAGGSTVKRWKINFPQYNVSLNVEDQGDNLLVNVL